MSDGTKQIRGLVRLAKRLGWRVETGGGGHLKWWPPNPRIPRVITGKTVSDVRAIRNITARLRRAGLPC